jgi:hypothetical protein
MNEIKHVGRIKTTGKKCLVAYRTLPGEAHSCLVVATENLSDSYHDALINLVQSTAGQDAYEFAEAMARTNFPDGSIMLAALHTQGRLVKIPTSNVEMQPTPQVSILLSELNQIIAEQRGVAVDDLSIKDGNIDKKEETKTAPVAKEVAPTTSTEVLTDEALAKKYRSDADRLSKEAAELRRQAESLVPTKKAK